VIAAGRAAGGGVAPGYEAVRDAFAAVAAEGSRSAFAACVDGELVADLWAGEGWERDTATVLYSGTKGVVAAVILLLVDRGALDLGAAVAAVWPEFAAAGKSEVTIATLLAHGAGLPAVERTLTRADVAEPEAVEAALAAQAPMLPLGTPTYHAVTWGWLADALVRRAAGASAGAAVRTLLAAPLGLDLRVGLPPGDPLAARVLRPRAAPGYRLSAFMAADPDPRLERVYGNPPVAIEAWCDPDLAAAEVAAVNGVGTARALATMYGRLVCGLVAPETLRRAGEQACAGPDALTGRPLRYGPAGHELAGTPSELGAAADALGHTGAGGGSHGAWPSLRTGFSFLTADLRSQDDDPRAATVLAALHAAVSAA
jgi:CubicO group peptidase (beta-lactamase class C family)